MTSVLIVEDDATFRSSIGRDLGLRGLEVKLAANADEALGHLEHAAFDVLLTDLRLGGRDGIDLLKRARAVAPRTRAVLMSGFATARDYQRAIELGAVRVLLKPFTSAELFQAIEHARACSSGYSGNIHGLSLIDVLQLYQFARCSLVLHVAGTTGGRILLRDGAFVHAESGELEGEPALVAMLAAPSGTLRTEALPPDYPCTIERPPQAVLLDCLRLVDEGLLVEPRPAPPPAPAAEEPDPAETARGRIRAYWEELVAAARAPETADVVGVDLASGTSVRLAGHGDPEPWIEPTQALVAAARAFSASERGGIEAALGGVQVALVWNAPLRIAFLITDLATSPAASAWFRAFAHAVAREQIEPTLARRARAQSAQIQTGDRDGTNR